MCIRFPTIPFRLLALMIFQYVFVNGQPVHMQFYISDSMTFMNNGSTMQEPFTGGFNLPVYSQADINNDGKPDILVFDRSGNVFLTYINTGVAGSYSYQYAPQYEFLFRDIPATTFALFRDFNQDGKPDLFTLENQRLRVYINTTSSQDPHINLRKMGELYFRNTTDGPIKYNLMGGRQRDLPLIVDLDGDGDLDFVTFSALNSNLLLFKNEQVEKKLPNDTFYFRLVDFCWGGFRETFNNEIILNCNKQHYPAYYSYINNDSIEFRELRPDRRHEAGTTLFAYDMDNDGDLDLVMGNGEYQNLLYLTNGRKELGLKYDSMVQYVNYFPERGFHEIKMPYTPGLYDFDVTGNGVKDIVASPYFVESFISTHNSWLIENRGTNENPEFKVKSRDFLIENTLNLGKNISPVFWDIDGNGLQDLLLCVEPDSVMNPENKYASIYRFNNVGSVDLPVFELTETDFAGVKSLQLNFVSLALGDLNRDGLMDLVLGNFQGNILYLRNTSSNSKEKNPTFQLQNNNLLNTSAGVLAHPAVFDYNRDGFPDLIIGNKDGFFSYYENNAQPQNVSFKLITHRFGNVRSNYYDTVSGNQPYFHAIGNSSPVFFDFDNDQKPELITGSSHGELKVWYISYNPNNTFPEVKDFYGIINANGDTSKSISLGNDVKLAVTRFKPQGPAEVIVGTNRGGIKFLSARAAPPENLNIHQHTFVPFTFRIVPNPNNGTFDVDIPLEIRQGNTSQIQIRDITGRILYHTKITDHTPSFKLQLQKGIYFCQLYSNGQWMGTQKFIIQ